jgi:hypothetical protein
MWPYTSEELNSITYGISKKMKNFKKIKQNGLILASIIPSVLIVLLILTII